MDKNLTAKVSITALISGISAVLGWKGILAVVWVAVMALDYLSGTAAACKSGQWSSAAAREGLWHKGSMILVVAVAGIADIVLGMICARIPSMSVKWMGFVLPLVLVWYIITELGSILENATKMGATVPGWLTRLLKASAKAAEAAGENIES